MMAKFGEFCAPHSVLVVSLIVLMATLLRVPAGDATPEGDTLFKLSQLWNVDFPSWKAGGDPCAESWAYIDCWDGHVTGMNLSNTGITGTFPPELGDLKYLEVLDLSNLYLSTKDKNNSLSGPLPDSLANCKYLRSVNTSNMALETELPSVLTKLPELAELYMSSNKLTGTFPDEFYNLGNLRHLYIGDNRLKGDMKKLARLQSLSLVSIFALDMTGTIPEELALNTPNMVYFNCHTCKLYGPLPESFSQWTRLQNLTLNRNNLTGPIPKSWKGMKSMINFRLDSNYLTGEFPMWMFDEWPICNSVKLGKNRFSGPNPNITYLEKTYNASYFDRLSWDCNYLDGFKPCQAVNCTAMTIKQIESKSQYFNFDNNCYRDANYLSLDTVATECDQYHPTDVSCIDFYRNLDAGRCPRCPTGQTPWAIDGKDCVCQLKKSKGFAGIPIGAVVGGVLGIVTVFLIIIAFILYKRRAHFSFMDRFSIKKQTDEFWEVPSGVERFSKQYILKITQDFNEDNVIGQGGFGKVFMGHLDDGRKVAIKRASLSGLQGIFEFHNEVTVLSRLRHRHLVRLEGFCDEGDLQILVYEYVPRGNLHAHLLGKLTTTPLSWIQRLEIAYGVAQALEYLHTFANPPVIHRDVKPSNILLDDNMVAKVSDFGISRIHEVYDTHVSTCPVGTAGYLDPDYFMRRQLTTASDVYAYGVVLLELVTGQEAIDHTRLEEFNLIEWVSKRFRTSGILSVVDPLIEDDFSAQTFTEMAKLGLQCAAFNRNERPSMKVVLGALGPHIMMHCVHAAGSRKDHRSTNSSPIDLHTQYLRSSPSMQDYSENDQASRSLLSASPVHRTGNTGLSSTSTSSADGPSLQLLDMSRRMRPR